MWLTAVRDIAIVMLALESLVIGVLLAVMLMQIRKLVRMLREEIAPLLNSANETARTVQGTTTFISETVVNPIIKARSYTTGVWQAARTLLLLGQRAKPQNLDIGSDRTSED